MKTHRIFLAIAVLLILLRGDSASAHKFGSTPYDDVLFAAYNHNTCPELDPDQLVALMLSITWWEAAGQDSGNINRTPSPMTLSRGDNNALLYPPGQSGTITAPHRRAFWHPGIGAWQLDDSGLGSRLSTGKFNTWDAARLVAEIISDRYCRFPQDASYIFSGWYGCGPDGSLCERTAKELYNSNGPPAHLIERDSMVGRYGGAQVRTCRLAGHLETFVCYYVDPGNAEGYKPTWIYEPFAGVLPNGDPPRPSPLSKPFYVYREDFAGGAYEWRYWLAADTGFGLDYAAKRAYGKDSRNGLGWEVNAEDSLGLCDVTTLRGSCGVCTVGSSVNGLAASCGPEAPAVTTFDATNITQQSASLNLSVDPNGSPTTVWFDWDIDTSFCCSVPNPHQSVGSSTSTIPVSIALDGLTCNTTYYFRARAENTAGGATGSATPGQTLSFQTDPCSGGGSETTNLVRNGDFQADSSFWTLWGDFYADDRFNNYHDNPGYGYLSNFDGTRGNGLIGTMYQQVTIPANATAATLVFWTNIGTNEPAGGAAEDFLNATLQDSGGNFLAHLRVYSNQDASSGYVKREFNLANFIGKTIRINFLGTTNNDGQPTVFRIDDIRLDVVLPLASAPTVTTESADQVTTDSARLTMMVNPKGASTTVWFDLEAGDPTPNDDTMHLSIGAGSQSEQVSINVFGLECNTTYYFRANAQNEKGSDQGSVRSFTTSACSGGAPTADTDPAVNITKTSATLTADINPHGLQTEAWFAWGSSSGLGQETTPVSVGAGTGNIDFSQTLSGLVCGTTYYFESHAQNEAGHDDGTTLSFTTTSCDPGSLPIITVSAVDDSASEEGLAAGKFRISRTGSTSASLNLAYSFSGTAGYGVDYESPPTLVIPSGSSFLDVVVQPKQDSEVEPNETVVLDIQPIANSYTVGTPGSATVTITSDDGASWTFSDGFESGSLSAWLATPSAGSPIVYKLTQGGPGQPGKDIWTTSVYSYSGAGGGPGGGLDNEKLINGGWGDLYYSLIEFNLTGLPVHASSVLLELFTVQTRDVARTALFLDRITEPWDWRTQGTGSDRERLWWADKPAAVQWRTEPLATPPAVGEWYAMGITDLYNAWQDGSLPNYGVQLRPVLFGNNWSEFLSSNSADPALHPRLVIVPHPMIGLWRGTVASYQSDLTISHSLGAFTALLAMAQANEPLETLVVNSVTETSMSLYRPADDAELHLSLTRVGGVQCLVGEYTEPGTSRPVSLCQVQ